MPDINTHIDIAAPPSLVRNILLDFAAYPQWNPFITSAQAANPAVPPGTPFQIVAWGWFVDKSTIVENDSHKFAWTGIILRKWVFRGHHYFKFEPCGDEVGEDGEKKNTRLVQGEQMSGILMVIGFVFVAPILKRTFNKMNRALKKRAENMVTTGGGQAS